MLSRTGLKLKRPKSLLLKIIVIFVPIFSIAYISQEMVYVLPACAVAGLIFTETKAEASKDNAESESDSGE